MKGAGLARLYDVLTPEERFRLMLTARAREDEAEVDRLERACPRKSYTMPDATYLDRRELIQPITLAVCLDLTQYLAKMEVAAAFAGALEQLDGMVGDKAAEAAYRGHRLGTGTRRGKRDDEDPALEELLEAASEGATRVITPLRNGAEKLSTHFAGKAREVWDGFGHFCRAEVGLQPETVVGALFAPMLERLERQREALDAAEPDPTKVNEYERTLTEGWRRVLGLQNPRMPAEARPAPPEPGARTV